MEHNDIDIDTLKEKVETDLYDKMIPIIMQLKDNLHNSHGVLQKELENTMLRSVMDIRQVVSDLKDDNIAHLMDFEKRLSNMEKKLWPKWKMYSLYFIISLLIGYNFYVSRRKLEAYVHVIENIETEYVCEENCLMHDTDDEDYIQETDTNHDE